MNYIILDLEWDSAYCKKKGGFANQIIQIGAVKLSEDFSFVDKFEAVVHSCLSKKLSKRFIELTGITNDDMQNGLPFSQAVALYNSWVGEDTVTITWSNSDLYVILENEKLFLEDGTVFKMEKYVDLQSYVQNELRGKGHEIKNQISLSLAAEMLKISTDKFDLHTAVDDSFITAALLRKTYNEKRFMPFIKDTKNPEFRERLLFKNSYITRLNDKDLDKKQLEFRCPKCNAQAKSIKKMRCHNRWFITEFHCPQCEYSFVGRVMFKRTYNGIKVNHRITPVVEKPKQTEELALTKA